MRENGKKLKTAHRRVRLAAGLLAVFLVVSGCYSVRGSRGGARAEPTGEREVNPAAVALPEGFVIEAVATGLTFPTGITFDADGVPFVTEAGYSYGEVRTTPRLLRLSGGSATVVASGDGNGPWNGVAWSDGFFYVSEGGTDRGGRILKIGPGGAFEALVSGLPSLGDHHTNGPAAGADGWIYFGQGTATNSGVVGTDNMDFGWLSRQPQFHDIPCRDVTLAGAAFRSGNPLTPDGNDTAVTGAYSPFGVAAENGTVVRGDVPCSGSVMRVRPDGSGLELVAWGFRNPYGLAFRFGGSLFVTDNGFDDRGSRPVWGTADFLWEVTPGTWYGWPDFSGGRPVSNPDFTPPGKDTPARLLAAYPNEPPVPAAEFGVHSSSNGLDFSRSEAFGWPGEAFVAQLGDMAPNVGKVLAPVGFRVVRVNPETGVVVDFATNRGKTNGPASLIGGGGLERPVAVRFSPDGKSLYIVDFGELSVRDGQSIPRQKTGVVWKVERGVGR